MQVALISDDALLRDGIQCLLATMSNCSVVAAGGSWHEIEGRIRQGSMTLLILAGATLSGNELGRLMRMQRRLGFSIASDSHSAGLVPDATFDRATGFEGIRAALRRVMESSKVHETAAVYGVRHDLTPREHEVARLVSQGMPNRRIATVLGIQEQSVKNLVSVVMRKLRCENRVQLALHLSSARQ